MTDVPKDSPLGKHLAFTERLEIGQAMTKQTEATPRARFVKGHLCNTLYSWAENSKANGVVLAANLMAAIDRIETLERDLTALLAECDAMREALTEANEWIKNWSPSFTDDDEWPATQNKIDAALARRTEGSTTT